MAFQINDKMLKNLNKVEDSAGRADAINRFRIEYLPLEQIRRSEKNFYTIEYIEGLAQDILVNGLQHNIVVRKLNSENEATAAAYEIISGERRFTAYKMLYTEHGDKYKFIPSKVVDVDDINAEILLIQSNAQTRVLSPTERLRQVQRMTELLNIKKAAGESIGGKIRDIVADELGMGATQIGKYQTIDKNLNEELKEKFIAEELTVTQAAEIARLPQEEQVLAYEERKKTPKKIDVPGPQYSQKPGRIKKNEYRFSYICPECEAELFSNSKLDVRCEGCNVLFVLGEA